jgi:Tfp pilus assembly protein PilV
MLTLDFGIFSFSETGHPSGRQGPRVFAPGRSSPPKGVTLIEVLVALAFLAVFAVGMTGLAIAILNGNTKSKSTDIAVYLALDKLETIRKTAYASITAANFPADTYTVGNPPLVFQRSVTIQDNTPTTGVKRVVVTVVTPQRSSVRQEMVVGQ